MSEPNPRNIFVTVGGGLREGLWHFKPHLRHVKKLPMFLVHEIRQGFYRYKRFLTRIFFELKITKMWIKVKNNVTINNSMNSEWRKWKMSEKSCEHILKNWFREADNLYHFLKWRTTWPKYLKFLIIELWVSICFLIIYSINGNIYCSVPLVKPS